MNPNHEALEAMLTRLHFTAIRDQLDSLLDEAAKRALTLREAVAFLCEREVSRRDERRVEMATKIAHFPMLRDLDSFDFAAQPSIDKAQIRDLAACRWIAHGEALLLWGRPGSARRIWRSRSAASPFARAIRCCSRPRPPSSRRWPAHMPMDGWKSGSASTPSPSC
jgi:hypothetical protein